MAVEGLLMTDKFDGKSAKKVEEESKEVSCVRAGPEPHTRLKNSTSDRANIVGCGWAKRTMLSEGDTDHENSWTLMLTTRHICGARRVGEARCPTPDGQWTMAGPGRTSREKVGELRRGVCGRQRLLSG